MDNAGSGMHPLPAKMSRSDVQLQLRSARGARSVRMLPSALVRMLPSALVRLRGVPSAFIASRFIEPVLLLFMSVVAGMGLVVAPEVEVLGVAFIEPVDDGVLGVVAIGMAGVAGAAGWFWVCGLVPVVLPVAVCAVAKPIAPIMVAAAAAVTRSLDAFM